MSLFNTFNAYMAGLGGLPTSSISLDKSVSANLSKSFANFGTFDTTKWTFSTWFKRVSDSDSDAYFSVGTQNPTRCIEILNQAGTNQLEVRTSKDGAAIDGHLVTTASFEGAAWYHMAVNFSSATSLLELYVNGSKITSFSTNVAPTGAVYASPDIVYVGQSSGLYMNGLLFQPCFISGNNPANSLLYNGGHPVDVTPITGLFSLLNTNGSDAITKDYVNPVAWTNNGPATKSVTVPT